MPSPPAFEVLIGISSKPITPPGSADLGIGAGAQGRIGTASEDTPRGHPPLGTPITGLAPAAQVTYIGCNE